jgi:hypothetical protein
MKIYDKFIARVIERTESHRWAIDKTTMMKAAHWCNKKNSLTILNY